MAAGEGNELTAVTIYAVPGPTNRLPVSLEDREGPLILTYEYCLDPPDAIKAGFRVEGVRAYRVQADAHCELWMIEASGGDLVEVVNSAWVEELRTRDVYREHRDIHHYLIWFDDVGCYEIIAASCSPF